jgi:hypothetical protein
MGGWRGRGRAGSAMDALLSTSTHHNSLRTALSLDNTGNAFYWGMKKKNSQGNIQSSQTPIHNRNTQQPEI